MKVLKKEKIVEHPLEQVFDIEEQTTIVEYTEVVPSEVLPSVGYDEKDNDIEEKLESIYTSAMGGANEIAEQIETVEGKYKARMGEVTATMLNVALGAVREKSLLKQHKDKLGVTLKTTANPKTLNQNLIVADRNEILRLISGQEHK